MAIRKLLKSEIVLILFGMSYSVFLILKNPQPFGNIALLAIFLFLIISFIKKEIIRKVLQIITLIGVLLFSTLGTRSLLFNMTNEALFESPTKVAFSNEIFSVSLAKAKTENKLVFIDFYTVWCGPCIDFHNNVLSNEEVATYMNKAFVNTKFNLYKGEGIKLKEIYEVTYVPRFLIVDSNGEIVEDISTDTLITAKRMIKITKNYLK